MARLLRPKRLAAVLLLMLWVGPVSIEQSGGWSVFRMVGAPPPAEAETRFIPAGKAILLDPGAKLQLKLKDGSVVQGRFLGRALLDSALYAPRFHARSSSTQFAPFALGETLSVALHDGRRYVAPFAGYAEMCLLLESPDGGPHLRVPFEFAREIQRANGDRVDPRPLAKAFRQSMLPSAEALVLGQPGMDDPWASALRVPVEDIDVAVLDLGPGGQGTVALVLFLVAIVVVAIAASHHSEPKGPSCEPTPGGLGAFSARAHLHLTERPFDRDRGCFVGDPLAVADPWPGTPQGSPAALAVP